MGDTGTVDVQSDVVYAEPDDTPSDMDDSVSLSTQYLDHLLIKAYRKTKIHCSTCSCDL